jgi:hypothetical protein
MQVAKGLDAQRRRHWEVLFFSVGALVAAPLLKVLPDEQVALLAAPSVVLPPTCMSREWFGVSCPGCGLTRSFIHIAHGDWTESLRVHRLGWLLMVVAALQVPYRTHLLLGSRRFALHDRVASAIGTALIALLVANWGLAFAGF